MFGQEDFLQDRCELFVFCRIMSGDLFLLFYPHVTVISEFTNNIYTIIKFEISRFQLK